LIGLVIELLEQQGFCSMDARKLQKLLCQNEGASLEFKREFYKIYEGDPEARKRQKHEFIKDILSLANGNESVAGETAYLIIGADNRLNDMGGRDLYDTSSSKLPDPIAILGMVNAFCEPPLAEVQCSTIEIEGKQIFIIVIPPSPHLHELVKKLETPSQVFSEYATLVRHNESVELASAKQRSAILSLKHIRLSEMENPPDLVGGMIGFTLGFIAGGISPFPLTENKDFNSEISPYVGGVIGALLGQAIGMLYYRKYQLQKKYPKHFVLIEGSWFLATGIGGYLLLFILKKALGKPIRRDSHS
jgi:hypothetical protein